MRGKECSKRDSRKFQGPFEQVSKGFQEGVKDVSGVYILIFPECVHKMFEVF